MYYEYHCPVGAKDGKHRHNISGARQNKAPKCCHCGAEMVGQQFGTAGHFENSPATDGKWKQFGPRMPEAQVVVPIKTKRKAKKDEAGMLGGYVNPTDELKGDIERMAVNA
jgi:hypothetical protein